MGYRVRIFDFGDPKVWQYIGPHLCDREVIKEMEGPIYCGPGTTWIVAIEESRGIGFVTSRDGGDCWWHDYAYVVPEKRRSGVFISMAGERERLEAKRGKRVVKTAVKNSRWHHYEGRGFSVDSRRGKWVYGSRGVTSATV